MPCVFEEHYYTLHEESDRYDDEFRRICAFDIVINNTDRKAGHCVLGVDDRIWAIDHGVAFHQEFKLRTVLWDLSTRTSPDAWCDDLWRLVEHPPAQFEELLNPFERDAVTTRTTALGAARRFPEMRPGTSLSLAVGLTFRRRCRLGIAELSAIFPLTQEKSEKHAANPAPKNQMCYVV